MSPLLFWVASAMKKNLIDSNGDRDKVIQQEGNLRRTDDKFPLLIFTEYLDGAMTWYCPHTSISPSSCDALSGMGQRPWLHAMCLLSFYFFT